MPKPGTRPYLALSSLVVLTAVLASPVTTTTASAQSTERQCRMNAIERSKCIIDAILADIETSYRFTGGGGIASITQKATDTYVVSIPQEERVDTLTYEAKVSESGKVTLSKPVLGAE